MNYFVVLSEFYIILCSHYHSLRAIPLLSTVSDDLWHGAHKIAISMYFLLGTSLILAGTTLRILCFRWLGRHFTFELSVKKDHQLVTDGPYAYVRHPSYAGSTATLMGVILAGVGRGSWLFECGLWGSSSIWGVVGVSWVTFYSVAALLLLLRVPKEDEVLGDHFKGQWGEWAKRTPYRVIPFLF